MERLDQKTCFDSLPPVRSIPDFYEKGYPLSGKMVVLDDDPTGVQTVHGIHVYTSWDHESLLQAFTEPGHIFFLLTNSRSLSRTQTEELHRNLASEACRVSRETGIPFIFLSRSDSTLRGHYPLETETLRRVLIAENFPEPDGEIIAPFFPEGGRYTIGNIHYVQEGKLLVPAGQTEFAADPTFGYSSSNLIDWVREKNPAISKEESVHSISLDTIRLGGPAAVAEKLLAVQNYEKVIVNSCTYSDMEVFVSGLYLAMQHGKRFLFRTAAGLVRVMASIPEVPLLSWEQLRSGVNQNGGLVLVGSHVQKTTHQLANLLQQPGITPLKLDVRLLTGSSKTARITEYARQLDSILSRGETAAAFTSREVVRITQENSESNLLFSKQVSDSLVEIVRSLTVRPSFLVAKGGITSSEIGVRGLNVKRALVAGQILPGIPVWQLGLESRYPGLMYVIFPGNVGDENALCTVVKKASESLSRQ